MTSHATGLSEELTRGARCHVCTGCGRCPAGRKPFHIIGDEGQGKGEMEYPPVKLEYPLIGVDIGTTTIAMNLYLPEEAGRASESFGIENPQRRYGSDVLSRIRAAEDERVAHRLQRDVLDVLEEGIARFRRRLSPSQAGELKMSIAANTTMTYLLLGYPPAELGRAPFHAKHLDEVVLEIGGIPTVILPGISAFVGGDIVAGIYGTGLWQKEGVSLLIDLGTNGEMVIGNSRGLLSSATAAGPAFEGGAARGIWGSDMISITARLLRENIVDETGLLTDIYFDEGVRAGDITVTQKAIRSLQMAKGAIGAGIHILARRYGLSSWEEVDEVVLAGGFGYYLKPEDAVAIGLIPEGLAGRIRPGGNTSLRGALAYGSRRWGRTPGELAGFSDFLKNACRTVNLAEDGEFEEIYIGAMNLEKM